MELACVKRPRQDPFLPGNPFPGPIVNAKQCLTCLVTKRGLTVGKNPRSDRPQPCDSPRNAWLSPSSVGSSHGRLPSSGSPEAGRAAPRRQQGRLCQARREGCHQHGPAVPGHSAAMAAGEPWPAVPGPGASKSRQQEPGRTDAAEARCRRPELRHSSRGERGSKPGGQAGRGAGETATSRRARR